MNNIFKETQQERDEELSVYSGKSIEFLQKVSVGDKRSLIIHCGSKTYTGKYADLYKEYPHMNSVYYLRTLAAYTVSRRAKDIVYLEKIMKGFTSKRILDFGCGVGSHSIYCLQKNAHVDMLDVPGPLFAYAKWRVTRRKLKNYLFFDHTDDFSCNKYDAIICLDVLEHVDDPISCFTKITNALKPGGFLSLEVSTMIKPSSGHFADSIELWKQKGTKILKKKYEHIMKKVYRKC